MTKNHFVSDSERSFSIKDNDGRFVITLIWSSNNEAELSVFTEDLSDRPPRRLLFQLNESDLSAFLKGISSLAQGWDEK